MLCCAAEELRLLSIAQSLVQQPAVLLVDEPTAGLAPPAAARVMAALRALATQQAFTVVAAVSALPAAADAAADAVVVLHSGHVVYQGPPGVAPSP